MLRKVSNRTIYILECADGSYFGGWCRNLHEELDELKDHHKKFFRDPGKFPVRVVFKDADLPYEEAFLKFSYLRKMNRTCRARMIRKQKWPPAKMLKKLILKKMGEIFENNPVVMI